jgi:dipeptidyl aminopeptidase/acylaminoacyl peptidase
VQQKEQEGKSVRGMLEALLGAPLKGAEARYSTASPINYVSKKTVPTLLTHGTADPLVPIEQSELFYAKLKSAGVDLDYMRIDGGVIGQVKMYVFR